MKGDLIVVGHRGVKVVPAETERPHGAHDFEFMSSAVSTEKPKNVIIHDIAQKLKEVKRQGKRILLVGGPAIVHTGSARHVVKLIEQGYVQVLFAGNALATHDIEQAIYGTSLGVHMERAIPADTGHEHHLRAINTVRRYGSIRRAIDAGVITSGIMHACIRHNVEVVLAGSIRDDGPLPEVITDALAAQDAMREHTVRATGAVFVATALHAIAVGNMLPAFHTQTVDGHPAPLMTICVDQTEFVVNKLKDRGTHQAFGVVTNAQDFMHVLRFYVEQCSN
jgi:lysine-ketoglutarate reductase/saccharopine dehydrogenase-like protein (TIGR00300 family)